MRCPTCGTENTPDSRFCGGCGAKQFPSEPPRVAPTAKISDDAPYPQSIPPSSYAASPAGYSSGPASIPPPYSPPPPPSTYIPTTNPGAAIPPRGGSVPPSVSRANTAQPGGYSVQPNIAAPSMSMAAAPPRTRWGLVIVVLMFDLGLAAAGAVMLGKGLAKPERNEPAKADPSPVQLQNGSGSAQAPKPTGSAAVVTPNVGSALVEITEPTAVATSARSAVKAEKKSQKVVKLDPPATGSAVASGSGLPPPPPPPEVDVMKTLGNEIELQATRTRDTFDRCYFDAGGASAIHGVINVAFQVLTDGRIANVSAVENTTGSIALANCLTSSIARWAFASHPATNSNFVRPFNYP